MSLETALAWVRVRGDLSQVETDIHHAEGGVVRAMEGMAEKMNSVLAKVGVGFGLYELVRLFREAGEKAHEAQEATDKLSVAMQSMGQGIGFGRDQLQGWIKGISENTATSSVELQKAATGLLKYQNIMGNTFRDTLEMGASMGTIFGSVEEAVEHLGRAFEYPDHAQRMFMKLGIHMYPQEMKMLNVWRQQGQVFKQQEYIMQKLRAHNVKGMGEAYLKTPAGQMKMSEHRVSEAFKRLGKAWEPIQLSLNKIKLAFFEMMTPIADKVGVLGEKFFEWNNKLAGAPIRIALVTGAILALIPAVKVLLSTFSMSPIGAIVTGLAFGIAMLYEQEGDLLSITRPLDAAIRSLSGAFGVVDQSAASLGDTFGGIADFMSTFVKTVAQQLLVLANRLAGIVIMWKVFRGQMTAQEESAWIKQRDKEEKQFAYESNPNSTYAQRRKEQRKKELEDRKKKIEGAGASPLTSADAATRAPVRDLQSGFGSGFMAFRDYGKRVQEALTQNVLGAGLNRIAGLQEQNVNATRAVQNAVNQLAGPLGQR